MTATLRDGTTTEDPRLDRLVQFDERSRNFPVRALIPTTQPRSYTWACGVWLDQGQEGSCVGHGVAHEVAARPKVKPGMTHEIAVEVYKRAQEIDEWPGSAYSGTSVLAGVKVGVERGWFSAYSWAFGLDDALLAIGRKGPGIAGLNWYSDMFNTDANGFIHASGQAKGGHCILVRGVSLKGGYVLMRNSWGQRWGANGDAKLSIADFGKLLAEGGELCIPVRK